MLGAGSPRMGRRHSDSTPYRMSSASPTATPSPTPSNVTNLVGGGERPSSALPATGRAINNSSSATYGGAGPNSQTVPQFVIGATDIGGSAELPTVPTVAPPSELEQNNVMQAFDVAARMPFDVTGPEWAAWRLYAGHRRRQPLTPLAANLVDSQAAAATCGADASGTTQGGAVHSMLGSGAVSDAISAAYTSLRQRPSFSGLSAALTGGSSLNSATGNSTTGATDNTMSQQFASDSTPAAATAAATSALSSSPSEKRCTEATLLLTIEQEIAQRIQLQWAHMRASNGRISAPERVTLWAFDKRPNDAQQQQQSMSEQLISVGGVTAETGGAGAATAAEQQVHTISSISRHNSDRVRAILANARQLKGKERKSAIEILRCGAANMDKWRHLKMVHVVRSLEESSDALAFVSEPLACSLDTLLATMRRCGAAADNSSPYYANAQQQHQCQCLTPFELKYGLLQLTEALLYLHYSCRVIHRNVCPASVLINERRTWKLAGLEFALKCTDGPSDATVPRPCPAYNVKGGRVMQPETNFCAPEVFLTNTCSAQSDMFALGLLIGALFSAFGLAGHSASASASSSTDDRSHQLSLASTHLADQENTQAALMIQCNGNPAIYLKQLEQLNVAIPRVMPHVPTTLREPLRALLDVDASRRPTSESFSMVNYFSDDGVHALQYLDMIEQQDSVHKSNYYYNLTGVLPSIPKRMWWAHILASILSECLKHELHAATVEPLVWMVREASAPEYAQILLPFIKILFVMPKSVQTHVALLENFCSLHNCTSSSTLSLTSCTLSGGDTEMLQLKSRTKTSTERKREKRKKLNQDHSTGPIDSRYSIQRDFNDNHATMINNDSITTMLNAAATTTTTSSLISNSSLDDDDELDNDFDDDDELDYHDDDDERLMNANQVPTSANFGSNSADQLTAPRVKQLKVELDVELAETMLVALDSPVDQIQAAALKACAWVAPHLSTCTLAKARVVPKVRAAFEANIDNTSVQCKVLKCVQRLLDRLDKTDVLDHVLPMLSRARLCEPTIAMTVVAIYRRLLDDDRRYGLTCNLISLRVIPNLTPALVSPSLKEDQFAKLVCLLQDMLNNVNQTQRQKIKLGKMSITSEQFGRDWPYMGNMNRTNEATQQAQLGNHQVDVRVSSAGAYRHSLGGSSNNGGALGHKPSSPVMPTLNITAATPVNYGSTADVNDPTLYYGVSGTVVSNVHREDEEDEAHNNHGEDDFDPNDMVTGGRGKSNNSDDDDDDDLAMEIAAIIRSQQPSPSAIAFAKTPSPAAGNTGQQRQINTASLSASVSPSPSPAPALRMPSLRTTTASPTNDKQCRPPTLRLEKRRTSTSMEDVIRRMSISAAGTPASGKPSGGGGSGGGIGSMLLKVNSSVPARRHSDNTIQPPRILIAPSSPEHHSSVSSRSGSRFKLNLGGSGSNKLSTGSNNSTRRHSSVSSNEPPSSMPSMFLNSTSFKTKSSTNLGLDFLLSNRSMKRRYSTASMLGHHTQKKAEDLLETIGTASMKGMAQIFGK